jgi:hypothetical protein
MQFHLALGHSNIQKMKTAQQLYGTLITSRTNQTPIYFWYDLQHSIVTAFDPELQRSITDPCIYYKMTKEVTFIMSVHVDDYAISYNNKEYFDTFCAFYKTKADITFSPKLNFILQMELQWTDNTLTINQNRQINALKCWNNPKSENFQQNKKRSNPENKKTNSNGKTCVNCGGTNHLSSQCHRLPENKEAFEAWKKANPQNDPKRQKTAPSTKPTVNNVVDINPNTQPRYNTQLKDDTEVANNFNNEELQDFEELSLDEGDKDVDQLLYELD